MEQNKYYQLVEVDAPQQEYHPTTKLDVINNAISGITSLGLYGAFLFFVYKVLIPTGRRIKEDTNVRDEAAGEA